MQLMGCNFEITVVASSKIEADKNIDAAVLEIKRIETLISSWISNSQTSFINKYAGIRPVEVDPELVELIERAKSISKLTDGAFDISFASIDKVWQFDGSMMKMPSKEIINQSVELIGFENIIIDNGNSSVFLKKKGMKIGFGGIGKGYAADKAKELLQKNGIESGIINASGDMNTWGRQPNGERWKVAFTNPFDKQKSFGLLPIEKGAVVTSGNYEKFVVFNDVRYTHIIDPRTGYPSSGILSVTIFAPKAELADALATSVFVMGIETGLNRINQLPNIECIIIDEKGKIHQSKNIKITHEN
ncbi:MAG: FAD:protein FMN transferase [Flavobacteriales bacterium]|nr:FAD:protein FMN transferase [Flavobacteriales bacterium]